MHAPSHQQRRLLAPHQTCRDSVSQNCDRPASRPRAAILPLPRCLSSTMTSYMPTPTTAPSTPLHIRRIDTPDDENIERVLAMSNDIFAVTDSTDKHGSLPYWRNHLSHPSSFIIYLASSIQPDLPVAFIFVIPRQYDPPLTNGAVRGLHIWLAGVSPEWRTAGCLTRMIRELDDIDTLSICTFQLRFPLMFDWLTRRGWLQEQKFPDGKVLFSRPKST